MGHVSDNELSRNLAKYLDEVGESRAPLVVTRQNARPVVMLSLDAWESIAEALHGRHHPARLPESIRKAEETVERPERHPIPAPASPRAAHARLMDMLTEGLPLGGDRFERDTLYDR